MLELVIWYLAGLLIWAVFTVLIYKSVCLRTQKKWLRRLALAIMILLPTWDVALALALYKPACWTWAKVEYYGKCESLDEYDCNKFSFTIPERNEGLNCPYSLERNDYDMPGFGFVELEYTDKRCGKIVGVIRGYRVETYYARPLLPFFSWAVRDRMSWFSCLDRRQWQEFKGNMLFSK